mmetsp:Transcript_64165/g.75187  ORF Transcript_64165/g.75187 Transcript_64165/m.75187 type:complete len:440 (-) Transcript_64165:132-1451(-)
MSWLISSLTSDSTTDKSCDGVGVPSASDDVLYAAASMCSPAVSSACPFSSIPSGTAFSPVSAVSSSVTSDSVASATSSSNTSSSASSSVKALYIRCSSASFSTSSSFASFSTFSFDASLTSSSSDDSSSAPSSCTATVSLSAFDALFLNLLVGASSNRSSITCPASLSISSAFSSPDSFGAMSTALGGLVSRVFTYTGVAKVVSAALWIGALPAVVSNGGELTTAGSGSSFVWRDAEWALVESTTIATSGSSGTMFDSSSFVPGASVTSSRSSSKSSKSSASTKSSASASSSASSHNSCVYPSTSAARFCLRCKSFQSKSSISFGVKSSSQMCWLYPRVVAAVWILDGNSFQSYSKTAIKLSSLFSSVRALVGVCSAISSFQTLREYPSALADIFWLRSRSCQDTASISLGVRSLSHLRWLYPKPSAANLAAFGRSCQS